MLRPGTPAPTLGEEQGPPVTDINDQKVEIDAFTSQGPLLLVLLRGFS